MNEFTKRKRYKAITEYSHLYMVMVEAPPVYMQSPHTIMKIPICGLCGNHGVIHTDAVTPYGVALGKQKHYCICPNGQALRFNRTSLKDR